MNKQINFFKQYKTPFLLVAKDKECLLLLGIIVGGLVLLLVENCSSPNKKRSLPYKLKYNLHELTHVGVITYMSELTWDVTYVS